MELKMGILKNLNLKIINLNIKFQNKNLIEEMNSTKN